MANQTPEASDQQRAREIARQAFELGEDGFPDSGCDYESEWQLQATALIVAALQAVRAEQSASDTAQRERLEARIAELESVVRASHSAIDHDAARAALKGSNG